MADCCNICGAKLTGRWERLTPGICRTLVKIWKHVVATRTNSVHLQRDLELDKNQYANTQKLRYFGLIAQVKDSPGSWLITRRGGLFLHGKTKVNRRLLIFRNHIKERSDETIDILEAMSCDTPTWPSAEWFITPEPVSRVVQQELF